MQYVVKQWANVALVFLTTFALVTFLPNFGEIALAQSLSSGDISGTITDPIGAAIPDAHVTIQSLDTGATYTFTTSGAGNYRASLLQPGTYSITATSPGFQTSTTTVHVSTGAVAGGDLKLMVGQSTQTVSVTEREPLLHTENADITTIFSTKQVQSLPNPGNDLTFVAQTAPGVVMNTTTASNGGAFGYGNFSTFGLPATSNTFTLNGMYLNEPFLNLNYSGATNMLLGNNAVSQVTVINNAYGAQYGGLAGAQVNEISKSGTNAFHGNAAYWWNGRAMNANSYFNNQTKNPRPFDNVNQFGASIGGPIFKNKTFFFGDYEGLRIILPVSQAVSAPSPNYINCILKGAPLTGQSCGSLGQVPASDVSFYQQILGVYTNAKGYNTAVVNANDPNVVNYNATMTNFSHEWLFQGRIDQHLSDKDSLYGTYDMDRGLQATYTDALNPIFNADSPQPQYSGQLGETHVFTPNVTNQFTFALLWYQAVYTNTNLAAARELVPYTFAWADGSYSLLGGENYLWPQGHNVTNYQFIDDISVIKGKNNFKFGYYFRRDDITDYSPSIMTTPLVEGSEQTFSTGNLDLYEQQFPTRLTQPIALYNEAGYFQDEWKALPNLNLTFGVRVEHNSNPICTTNCFSKLAGDFGGLSPDPTTPYNQLIQPGLHQSFVQFQKFAVVPRFGFAWSPWGDGTKTVIRGGFGMFTDVFPAIIADSVLNNAPTNAAFALFGPLFGVPATINTNPADSQSGQNITSASNAAFQSGFGNGASVESLSQSVPGFSAPSFTSPNHTLQYPTYEEWNLEIQRQLNSSTVLNVNYVGNRGYHEPNLNGGVNAYGGAPGFTGIDGVVPPNPSFGQVTQVYSDAISNSNGVTASLVHRSRSLLLQFNYTYSHALDEISNGGALGFSAGQSILQQTNPFNLSQNYGNSDYDSRHNITASYVYTLPYWRGPRVLTDGWEATGTVFHHTGFPFTVIDTAYSPAQYSSAIFARQIHNVHSCGKSSVFNNATGTGTPCGIANPSNYTDPTGFGQQERNQTFGPAYTDTDLALSKSFLVPGWESARLKVGAQFFNLLNHPNFSSPASNIGSPSSVGFITSTVNTPTSILGSDLGGDASPRLIQLKASFEF